MKHQEQIPLWSYINFQLLYQIDIAKRKNLMENVTIHDLIEKTGNHIGLNIDLSDFYLAINSGAVFSFLYSLIVVPKELFCRDPDFFNNFEFELSDYFDVGLGKEKIKTNKELFRILRNSISHVNYSIDEKDDYSVLLWNKNSKKEVDVKLNSDINRLSNFAVSFANYYNLKTSSQISKVV